MSATVSRQLGPLAHPVREDHPGDGLPPWKDNAYLVFWDPGQAVFGVVHVSTSPNADQGRRARATLSVAGRVGEVIEDLGPSTWTSDAITFAQDGRTITVHSEAVTLELEIGLRGRCADYNAHALVPALVEGQAPQHYQGAVVVTGSVAVADGSAVRIDGVGMRDRTWGFRDETAQFPEYYGLIVDLDGRMLTVMKFAQPGGEPLTDGFVIGDGEPIPARAITNLRRDASGLFVAATVTAETGEEFRLRLVERHAGFWVPMGWEREGPVMSAYDELIEVSAADGTHGFGLFEQGIVRQLS